MEERLVDIKDLEVHFPLKHETVRAVDGVSWHVNKGETLAIVGESGSGKSVTAMSLMRLTDYSGGKINSGSMNFIKNTILNLIFKFENFILYHDFLFYKKLSISRITKL